MIIKRLTIILFFVFSQAQADEIEQRRKIVESVGQMMHQQDFSGLEKMAADFRSNQERTSSGVWKLTFFYIAVSMNAKSSISVKPYWDWVFKITNNWLLAYPDSPVAYIAKSIVLYNKARSIKKQSGFDLDEAKAKAMYSEYIALSKSILTENYSVVSKDPHMFTMLVKLSKVQGGGAKGFITMIDDAFNKHPYYYQTYFDAISYLSPRWHGNSLYVEEFANAAVEHTKAKEGNAMYARIYWVASSVHYGTRLFTDSHVIWDKMRKGIDDVVASYPDKWNINNFAYFSCLAEDKKMTRKLLSMMKERPMKNVWKKIDTYNACKQWAFDGAI